MRYFRRVIRIRAQDSPNVKEAERLLRENPGIPLDELNERSTIIKGVLTWANYCHHRKVWGEQKQAAGLDAVFYEGAEVRLFPDAWLDRAERLAMERVRLQQHGSRNCLGMDAAEGGDNSAWAVVNQRGLVELRSRKTADTSDIPGETLAMMREFNVAPEDVGFDRGGGGKQHADALRRKGYNVRTVAFGEPMTLDPKRGMRTFGERVDIKEEKYEYRSRRAEMYHELAANSEFAMPAALLNRKRINNGPSLRDQLNKFPRLLDDDGRYWLPSKGVQTDEMKKRNIKTLTQIIGCSPDESDALVVADWIRRNPQRKSQAGAA